MKPFAEWLEKRKIFEYEQYVDEDGYAHDDEGNVSFVGKQYAGGTYGLHDLPSGIDVPDWRPKRRTVNPSFVDDMKKALERPTIGSSNRDFLSSVLSQVESGRGLTEKQIDAVKRVLDRINNPVLSKSVVVDSSQIDALKKALAIKEDRFLSSVLSQIQGGKSLSDKQKKIVRAIFYRLGMKPETDIFR